MDQAMQGGNIVSTAYGEGVPFGDPNWYRKYNSPYYNDSHRAYRDQVRAFVDEELTPNCRYGRSSVILITMPYFLVSIAPRFHSVNMNFLVRELIAPTTYGVGHASVCSVYQP